MSPTIVFDDRGPVLCIGAAGGSRIPTATEQVALRILVRGESPANAMAAPRVHHQGAPAELRTERFATAPAALLAALRDRGHVLGQLDNIAVVSLVRIDRSNASRTLLTAVSDPRKGGMPAGD
jgi:gamma-glutamyltranspeptidase